MHNVFDQRLEEYRLLVEPGLPTADAISASNRGERAGFLLVT